MSYVAGFKNQKLEDAELLYVKEVSVGRQRRSTSTTPPLLPHYLHFRFNVSGQDVNLRLVRNMDVSTNVPFTFAGKKEEKLYLPDRKVLSYHW